MQHYLKVTSVNTAVFLPLQTLNCAYFIILNWYRSTLLILDTTTFVTYTMSRAFDQCPLLCWRPHWLRLIRAEALLLIFLQSVKRAQRKICLLWWRLIAVKCHLRQRQSTRYNTAQTAVHENWRFFAPASVFDDPEVLLCCYSCWGETVHYIQLICGCADYTSTRSRRMSRCCQETNVLVTINTDISWRTQQSLMISWQHCRLGVTRLDNSWCKIQSECLPSLFSIQNRKFLWCI